MSENVETKQVKSKRDLLKERLRSKYPEKEFSDDEEFYGQISDDFDDSDKKLNDYKEREKTFSDMFTSDPRSASFITDWRNGEDPVIGLIRRFGPEIKDAIDDPNMQEQIAAANKEYIERLEQSKKLDEEYKQNISETLSYLDKMSEEGQLDDDKIDDAMAFLLKIVHEGVAGKFTPETIDMAVKAINHDVDVEDADRAGEVRGRNAKINEKLKKASRGDNLPVLDGANGNEPKQKDIRRNIFQLAKMAK